MCLRVSQWSFTGSKASVDIARLHTILMCTQGVYDHVAKAAATHTLSYIEQIQQHGHRGWQGQWSWFVHCANKE